MTCFVIMTFLALYCHIWMQPRIASSMPYHGVHQCIRLFHSYDLLPGELRGLTLHYQNYTPCITFETPTTQVFVMAR